MMRKKIWILLLLLLNNSLLLFSQHCHIGDIITNPDGSKGVVFYLNPDRLGGWMVALNDISSGCQWGSKEDIPRLPNYTAQTTDPLLLEMDGKENTRIIRAFQNNNLNYAAGKVDFEHGWYLPSIGQLRILYSKLALINSSLVANGGTVLGNGKYWSSTEHDADQAKTLAANQGCGFHSMTLKDQTCAVRAIRDFSFLQWSTDVVADSIEVSPTGTTTYSVLLIEGSTCPNFDYTATIEVVVSPVPQDVTINPAGPLQICESEELHLQAQTSNNKNWSYLWRDLTTQQVFPETSAELTTNDLSIGQHQIQVIVSSATNGNCSDSTMVEVEVFPPIEATLAGPALVCVDTEFDLAAEPIGEGLTYTWKRNGEVVPNWTGPEAHPEESIAGSYEYTVTISDGICTDESEPWTVVIEEIIPMLTAPVSICVDTQFDLVATPTGDGYTYTWKRNGEVVPNWTSSTIHLSEAVVGTYVYSVTVADGICTAESEPVTVEVEDLTANVSGPDRVCVGSLFTLEASPAVSSYSYTWKRNGIVISETGSSLYMTENNVGTFDYTVTISDGICTTESQPLTIAVEDLTATLTGPEVACVNVGFDLVAGPADGYTYTWKRNGMATTWTAATVPVTESATGQYEYSVTITNGICTDNASWTVLVEEVIASIEGPANVCPGESVTLMAKPDGMSYAWSNGSTSQSITVPAGNYSVTVTSTHSCQDEASLTVTEYPSFTASIEGPTQVCPGETVTLTAKPDGMSYAWSNGATSQSITVPAGNYSVTVTSSDNCSNEASHTVTEYPSFTASIEGPTQVCPDETVTLTAKPDGMSYAWNNGATTQSITVPAGNYSVTVTSSDNCSNEASHAVTEYPSFTASIEGPTQVCPGNPVTLSAKPDGMSSYVWSTGETDQVITVIPTAQSTAYSVTVTSADGCSDEASHVVTLSDAIDAWIDGPTSVCPDNTVPLTAKPDGLASYVWSTGETTQTITVAPGTYAVTVTSADGCEGTASQTVVEYPAFAASIEGDTEVCEGSPVTLTAYPEGMSYLWSTDETTRSITITPDAPSPTYEVTVTSADGCSDNATHTVTVKPLPIADAGEDVNVPYNTSATLTAADAGAGAEYHWEPANLIDGDPNQQTVTTVSLTDPQTFYLTVTLNGCESQNPDAVTVMVGDALFAYAIADPASVCPGSNTTLIVSASGGAGNNTYYWQPEDLIASGQGTAQVTTTDLPGTNPIEFTCLVTDGEGATFTAPVTVTLKPVPIADASGSDTYVSAGASATLIAANAGAGAVYHWSPDAFIDTGQGTMTATTVPLNDPMTFYLTVTLDDCESLESDEVTVSVGDALYATASAAPDSVCPGDVTTLTVTAMGGTEPYTYEWTPNDLIASGQGTDVVTTTALSADQPFTCMVTDEVGAHYTASVTVTVKPLPTTDAGADQSVPYEGTTTLTAADAGAGAEYHWEPADKIDGDPNQQTVTTVPLTEPINMFQLTVTLNGCESADPDEVTVFVGDALYATAAADPESVCPGGVVTLTVSAMGGTEPYTYEWQPQTYIDGDPNAQTVTTTALNTDQPFTCTVTDQEGATYTAQVTVTMKPLPLADASDSDHFVALGTPATLRAADAGAGAQYLWEPEDQIVAGQGTTTATTIPLPGPGPQPFYLTVTSPDGCINADLVNVEIGAPLDVTATADPVCQEEPALLTALPVGGTGQYTYQWEPQGLIANGQGTALATTEPLTESQLFDVTVSDGYDMKKVSVMVTVETPYVDTIPRSACHYYEWYGELYDEPGYHEHTVAGPVCDTTFVLYLEIVDEYNDTIPVTACDHYDWNGQSYDASGFHTASFVSELGCDSIVNLDLTIINPDIEILGYQDIYYASDVWHGIYHYYVVDSIAIPLAPIQWQCDNPNWILLPVSDYHCKLIATTEGSSTLTAHTLIAENCDEEMSILISAKPYYDDDDDDTTTALFPNPARSVVTVQAKGITHVRMFNLMGQTVREIKVNNPLNAIDMDTGNLERGVYLVEITTLNEVVVERLILATY
ncbi:MAG: T9SS type A sorting domain-containing protein [Bacteroidales bacterium]|nr:T9SS type A sorting domain-containing protein [Bacteroidales bacterium]